MKRFALAVVVLLACEGKVGVTTLIKTTPETTSAKCPAGGVLIQSGPDSDRNQRLDDSEVTQSSEVCAGTIGTNGMNGMNGTAPLVATTLLPPGDPHCQGGGTRIDVGLDDGKGGGTAGDGVLQPGEISSTRDVCNGAFPYYPGDTTPPAGPPGEYRIVTTGGATTSGESASGGNVHLGFDNGSLGGHVKVFSTGVADAGFTVPTMVPFTAGKTPMMVSTDLTVHAYDQVDAGVASNDLFFRVGGNLYSKSGEVVTSVSVAQAKTLTLENPGDDDLAFSGDFHNAGTVKTVVGQSLQPARLTLAVNRFVADPGSHLVADGSNNPVMGQTGGHGGVVILSASALLINFGGVSARGGGADTGGQGGSITFTVGDGPLYNLGDLDTTGGAGATLVGGNAGDIQLYAQGTDIFNSGNLTAAGGTGGTQGGNGGTVYFGEELSGPIRNSGRLVAKGGTCSGANCQGGSGGRAMLFAANGVLVSSGDVDTHGADGKGSGSGGSGGRINLRNAEQISAAGNVRLPTGSITVSGNLLASGGSGQSGGSGGNVDVVLDTLDNPLGQELVLLGYTLIDLSGGSATGSSGGASGQLDLSNSRSHFHELTAPGGGAYLYADVVAKGGDGTDGASGGTVSVSSQTHVNFGLASEAAGVFSKSLDCSGGAGHSLFGGNAGGLQLAGLGHAENHAKVTAVGGQASGGPATGGHGGSVTILSDNGAVTNTGDVDLSGGASSGNGGSGGDLTFIGNGCTTSGALESKGGNATMAGGSGGHMRLLASGGSATASTSSFDVTGGTGTPAGPKGQVRIDGADVTP